MIAELPVAQAKMSKESVFNETISSHSVFMTNFLVADLNHLRLWILLKYLRQSVGENSHEVLLSHFCKL